MWTKSQVKLGFWSAVLTAVFSATFSISGLLGLSNVLVFPWDPIIPDGASLLLAWAFIVMMICVHYRTPADKKLWSHIGLAFGILYAALVSIVYMVILTVVVPSIQLGQIDKVIPFVFDEKGSFMQAVDGIGYFFMCMATWFAAPAFANEGREKRVRQLFLLNGFLGIPIVLSYMPLVITWSIYLVPLGALWIFTVPACALLVAREFNCVLESSDATPKGTASRS